MAAAERSEEDLEVVAMAESWVVASVGRWEGLAYSKGRGMKERSSNRGSYKYRLDLKASRIDNELWGIPSQIRATSSSPLHRCLLQYNTSFGCFHSVPHSSKP